MGNIFEIGKNSKFSIQIFSGDNIVYVQVTDTHGNRRVFLKKHLKRYACTEKKTMFLHALFSTLTTCSKFLDSEKNFNFLNLVFESKKKYVSYNNTL